MIRAVLFDVGGVIISSPFEAFSRYEADHGLPDGFIRGLNSTNPDTNAWAHLERGDVSLPDDPTLLSELAALRYSYAASAKLQLEPKEQAKARLGRSPDLADAVALAIWAADSGAASGAGLLLRTLHGGAR